MIHPSVVMYQAAEVVAEDHQGAMEREGQADTATQGDAFGSVFVIVVAVVAVVVVPA